MSLQETAAFKVISLFSIEKPEWIGKLQCVLQPSDIPLVGGYYMISRPDQKRFQTTKLRRKNPGLTFLSIHGNRTGLDPELRNVLPTEGKNIGQPKSAKLAAQPYASAMRALFRPEDKYRSFTFQKKRYQVIMKDGEPFPWRWDFDEKRYWADHKASPDKPPFRYDYYDRLILPANAFLDLLFESVCDHFPDEYDNYLESVYQPEGFSPNAVK